MSATPLFCLLAAALTLAGCLSQVLDNWPRDPAVIDPDFRELSIQFANDEFVVSDATGGRIAVYGYKAGIPIHLQSPKSLLVNEEVYYREDSFVDANTKARSTVRGEIKRTIYHRLFGKKEISEWSALHISIQDQSGGSITATLTAPIDTHEYAATSRGKNFALIFDYLPRVSDLRHTEKGDVWYQYPDGWSISVVGDSGQIARFVQGSEIEQVLGMNAYTRPRYKGYLRRDVDSELQGDILSLLFFAQGFVGFTGSASRPDENVD